MSPAGSRDIAIDHAADGAKTRVGGAGPWRSYSRGKTGAAARGKPCRTLGKGVAGLARPLPIFIHRTAAAGLIWTALLTCLTNGLAYANGHASFGALSS